MGCCLGLGQYGAGYIHPWPCGGTRWGCSGCAGCGHGLRSVQGTENPAPLGLIAVGALVLMALVVRKAGRRSRSRSRSR